jgi:hypothetical protein
MQVRRALAGNAKPVVRRQDKILLGELADSISTINHLPESFTILPAPEDRRPVQTEGLETIEPTIIHKPHSWVDLMNNIVTAGSGVVQVLSDRLLQQLGETGTLDFIRKHNAVIRVNNVSNNAQIVNAMMAHSMSKSISLTSSEHQDYINRNPMIFKFLNPSKEGRITFRYAGMDWIQCDAVMADTGCDIMLITI